MPMPHYFDTATVVPSSVRKLENEVIIADVKFATGETLPVEFHLTLVNTFECKLQIEVDGVVFTMHDLDSDVRDYYHGLMDVAWKNQVKKQSDAHYEAVRVAVLGVEVAS